eukprot:c23657_g1_i1 orf=115-2307(+)
MKMRDMSSTAAFETCPSQRWRTLRGGAELASILRKNLLERECCRKKLSGVEKHHQGKPLLALCFTDIVCCCGVPEQEAIARVARAHACVDAVVDDDDDQKLITTVVHAHVVVVVDDDDQEADTHETSADADEHAEGKGDTHEEQADFDDVCDEVEGDTCAAHVDSDDHDEVEGDTHTDVCDEVEADTCAAHVDSDDHDVVEGDTHDTHEDFVLQCAGFDEHDEGVGETHEAHANFDDDNEMEAGTRAVIHADYDEDDGSDDGVDEGEADTHVNDDDGTGVENAHAGALSYPQELVYLEANEPGEYNSAQALPLLQSHRQHPPRKQARCLKPYPHGDEPHLPHDLLLDVLLRCLPLAQVISARAVCRAWHQALSSPRCFRLLVHNPDSARPYLIVQTSTPVNSSCLTFFDPARSCWPCTPIRLPPFPLSAAAGGLLCFRKGSSSACWNRVLLVGNPLTQQWRELPPVPIDVGSEHGRSPWCAMCADQFKGCYKVFVMHPFSDKILNIYTYDSTTGQWESYKQEHREPDALPNEGISTPKRTFNLSPNGSLLQVSCVEGRILLYNPTDRSFRVVNIVSYPRLLDTFDLDIKSAPYARLPTVAFCSEKFYLVGRISTAFSKVGGRLPFMLHGPVGIWELEVNMVGTHGVWVGPVARADEDLLECAIAGSDGTDFYVTTDCQNIIYLFLTGGTTMLAYDVASHKWAPMPGCPAAHLLSLQGEAYYQPLLWPGPL